MKTDSARNLQLLNVSDTAVTGASSDIWLRSPKEPHGEKIRTEQSEEKLFDFLHSSKEAWKGRSKAPASE